MICLEKMNLLKLSQTSSLNIDGLMQDCSISNALAMEIPQSCTKTSIWDYRLGQMLAKSFSLDNHMSLFVLTKIKLTTIFQVNYSVALDTRIIPSLS